MSIRGWFQAGLAPRSGLPRSTSPTTNQRRRLRPSCERLETLALLSTASPVISGYAFSDQNSNGLFDSGESPVAGSQLELRNASGAVVGSAATGPDGFYAFSSDRTQSSAPQSITQTITLPTSYTNGPSATLASALQLFDPSKGTLTGVRVSSTVKVVSTLQAENESPTVPTDITAVTYMNYDINGLSRPISGGSATSAPRFLATTFDGTRDFAGTSGVTYTDLTATDNQDLRLTSPADLAAFTSANGRTSISPTIGIHSSAAIGATNGSVKYQSSSSTAAVMTVTFDYVPNAPLSAGTYTIVPVSSPTGYAEGKASQNGVVVNGGQSSQALTVTLTGADSVHNDFGKVAVGGAQPGQATIKSTPAPQIATSTPAGAVQVRGNKTVFRSQGAARRNAIQPHVSPNRLHPTFGTRLAKARGHR